MINPTIIAVGASVISAGASTGICIWKQKKLDIEIEKFTSTVENSVEKLSKTVTIDVDDDYIHRIVERAVEKETSARITAESRAAVAAIKEDMSKKIQKEINKSYSDLKASVKKEMEEQVGRIDLDDIRKEIIAEGKEEANKQFKKDLDKIIEQYNDNLTQINTIYSNIAETLQGAGKKGTTLTIS